MFFKIIAHRTRKDQHLPRLLHTDVEASPHDPQSLLCSVEHKNSIAVRVDVATHDHRPLSPSSLEKASRIFTVEHIEDVMLKSEP